MLELFSPRTTLVVGISLQVDEEKLLATVRSLAEKTNTQLVLVHAVPPFAALNIASEGFALPYEDWERKQIDRGVELAQQQITRLREQLPESLIVDTRVLRDYPEDALETVAEETKASLIICGFSSQKDQLLWPRLSTAFSLLQHAKTPVLVVPLDKVINFKAARLPILLADDLQEESKSTLGGALGFSRSIAASDLFHVYVHPQSYREINEQVEKIRQAMIEGHIPLDPDFDAPQYIEKTKQSLKIELKERLQQAEPSLSQELKYHPKVCFGALSEELKRVMEQEQIRVLVVGRHHFFHRSRFHLGHLPYESMMGFGLAFLSIPELS